MATIDRICQENNEKEKKLVYSGILSPGPEALATRNTIESLTKSKLNTNILKSNKKFFNKCSTLCVNA